MPVPWLLLKSLLVSTILYAHREAEQLMDSEWFVWYESKQAWSVQCANSRIQQSQHSAKSRRHCHYVSQNCRLQIESASHLSRSLPSSDSRVRSIFADHRLTLAFITPEKDHPLCAKKFHIKIIQAVVKMTDFTPLCNPFANLRCETPNDLARRKTSKQDLVYRETPNDFAMQSIAPLVGDDHGLRATATTPAGEDAPDDTFPSFEQALGPDFEYCDTLAIKRFRHLPLHPQHLRPITAFEDIRFVLRSMRIEALQEKHAAVKAAADKERAEIALVASPGFSEAMVKHNSQRRKRRRGGRRPSSKDGQLSAEHPAVRARKAGNVRSQ